MSFNSNENYDTEPDSDLENLLERRINEKPDVERGIIFFEG